MNRLLLGFLLTAASVAAADVAVYMKPANIRPAVYSAARAEVTWMFAAAGIRVKWSETEPQRALAPVTIVIRVVSRTEAGFHPGALAYAHPFAEKPAIVVMYDRLQAAIEKFPRLEARVLSHVLSHEICHVLQRTNVHADSGLMKARWSAGDWRLMAGKPLPFTQSDLRRMHDGLAFFRSRTEID
jgi:hypothetical protein